MAGRAREEKVTPARRGENIPIVSGDCGPAGEAGEAEEGGGAAG